MCLDAGHAFSLFSLCFYVNNGAYSGYKGGKDVLLENLIFCLNVVLPTFTMILLGALAVYFGVMERRAMNKIGGAVFTWCISSRIFLDVSGADVNQMKDLRMTMYCFFATIITYIIIWVLARRFIKRRESVGAFIHVAYRSSFTILGLSMVRNMAGEAGAAKCAPLFAMVALVYNVLAVLCLCQSDSKEDGENPILGAGIKDIGGKLVTNPLILAVLFGLPFSIMSIKLPHLVLKPIQYLGDIAVPLALFCIGAGLEVSKIKSRLFYGVTAALIKTLFLAMLVVPVAVMLGFRGLDLAIIAILFTAANPSATYVMTAAMGGDGSLAAAGTLFSTVFSVFTTTAALYILKTLALI
ncbi:MAG: AEC family transporter [Clostridiales bacterium]